MERSLRLLYTDAWWRMGGGVPWCLPRSVRAFTERQHPDIPPQKVVDFNLHAVFDWYRQRQAGLSIARKAQEYLRIGRWFASAVAADLENRDLDPSVDAFFGFNTGCLETFNLLRSRKIFTVCDQIDPARVEEDLVIAESEKWPGWQTPDSLERVPKAYWERMRAEWQAANLVLVNSEWCKSALIRQGVPERKLLVAPINYLPDEPVGNLVREPSEELTVLWLASVNLRKGIQYLLRAARLLEKSPRIRFIIAGGIHITPMALATAPANVSFIGPVNRADAPSLFKQASVFVLPTLSDGFAISQLEAMNHGLPVITTPNCGRVVTDGTDGFVVPPADAAALAEAIATLDRDRSRLRSMQAEAIKTAKRFDIPTQARQVDAAVQKFREQSNRARDVNDEQSIEEGKSQYRGFDQTPGFNSQLPMSN